MSYIYRYKKNNFNKIVLNNIIVFYFLFCKIVFFVLGNDTNELRTRLNHINGFYAKFTQKISDPTGVVLQENYGELWVKHPNFFHYHIVGPEECFLISDSKTLWFYDPYVNQVTISWLSDVLDDTFLILLISDADTDWDKYFINKDKDNFFLLPKKNEYAMFKKVTIKITNQGIIKNFTILDKDNHRISYQLNNHFIGQFDMNKFNFILPDGVVIDEQRLERD